MKLYFPQWQGAGTGAGIEAGAQAILRYLNDPDVRTVSLNTGTANKWKEQVHHVNNFHAIYDQLARLHAYISEQQPVAIQTIGGDCGMEIVPVSFLNSIYDDLGVIWFDAHADINRPCDSPSCNFHGMPLRTLLGEGPDQMDSLLFSTIQASQIHYLGLRDIDDAERIRLEKGGIYHPRDLNTDQLVQTLTAKGIKNLYLHFDVDCLDPNEYEHTYYQVENGMAISEAEECIDALRARFNIVGTCILESTATTVQALRPIEGIVTSLLK